MHHDDYLGTTRAFYDTVVSDYAEQVRDELASKPLDRALLGGFAETVLATVAGPVADLGCGPGRVAAHLDALGVPVLGIDLSPEMVALARRSYPGLRFSEGSMVALDLADGALGGIVAWYSIIHTPEDRLPALFAEFRRVLAPGGHLLIAFQVGDEPLRLERPLGHAVSLDFHRRQPDSVADLLGQAGIAVGTRVLREPEGEAETTRHAYLIARA